MCLECDCPNNDDNNRNGDFHQRGDRVGTAVVEEHVVEVCLVGLEGRYALRDTAEHDTEGISYGHSKDGEGQRNKT